MQLHQLVSLIALALLTTGCAGINLPASAIGGECKVFPRPEFVVIGKRQYDQRWIDESVESGVAGCRWKRPTARPASLDQQPGVVVTVKRKKPSLRKRIKDRIWPAKVEPVVPVPPMPAPQTKPLMAEPEIILRPVEPADDLLDVPSSPVQPMPPPKKKRWFNR